MASIPGARFDITGASGSQGLLSPKASWRAYVLPRGAHASADSTGTLITFDSASAAARFAANNWIQAGLLVANIRQVSAVGGNSISVGGAALTVAENDRIYIIGNTQPTVSGGSATYTTPNTRIRQRDDDGSDLYTNSMVTSNADGLVQFWADANFYDVIVQDSNQANQGAIIDLEVGSVEGISTSLASVFGATVTINGALIVGDSGGNSVINSGDIYSKVSPVYNVKHTDYGAVGDGVTNDTAAVQEAIDAMPAAGGILYFPDHGTYLLGAITGKSNVTVEGAGSTLKSAADAMLNFTSDQNVRIRNCRFDGASAFRRQIVIEKAVNVVIEGCHFTAIAAATDNSDTSTIIAAGGCSQTIVTKNQFVDTNPTHIMVIGKDGTGDGTDVGGRDITFTNNLMLRFGPQGSTIGLGVYNNSSVSPCERIVFADNVCDTGGHPIQLNGVSGCVISGNVFEALINGPVIAGFDGSTRSTTIAINNNTVHDTTDEAIAVVHGDGVSIVGNAVSLAEFGISVQGCVNTAITGNVVRDITLGTNMLGIEVKPASGGLTTSRVTVTGNAVSNWGASGIRVVGACEDIVVSGNNVNGSSATAGIGIEISTSGGTASRVHVTGNEVSGVTMGIYARSWSGGTCMGNRVKTTGGVACEIESLDSRLTSDIVISGNHFDGNGANGLRLDDQFQGMSNVDIVYNTLKGTGVNSMRLGMSGSCTVAGNVNVRATEGWTAIDDDIEVAQQYGVQRVAATGVTLTPTAGRVYLITGASHFTMTNAGPCNSRLVDVFNEAGVTTAIVPASGQSVSGSTWGVSLSTNMMASFRFKYSTLNWEKLYDG